MSNTSCNIIPWRQIFMNIDLFVTDPCHTLHLCFLYLLEMECHTGCRVNFQTLMQQCARDEGGTEADPSFPPSPSPRPNHLNAAKPTDHDFHIVLHRTRRAYDAREFQEHPYILRAVSCCVYHSGWLMFFIQVGKGTESTQAVH